MLAKRLNPLQGLKPLVEGSANGVNKSPCGTTGPISTMLSNLSNSPFKARNRTQGL